VTSAIAKPFTALATGVDDALRPLLAEGGSLGGLGTGFRTVAGGIDNAAATATNSVRTAANGIQSRFATAIEEARLAPDAGSVQVGRVAGGTPAKGTPDFVADTQGNVVPTSASRLEEGFQNAGFPSTPTRSPGVQYTLPDGTTVRVMQAAGPAPRRASFENALGQPVNAFTGAVPQPPIGVVGAAWKQMFRELIHVELTP